GEGASRFQIPWSKQKPSSQLSFRWKWACSKALPAFIKLIHEPSIKLQSYLLPHRSLRPRRFPHHDPPHLRLLIHEPMRSLVLIHLHRSLDLPCCADSHMLTAHADPALAVDEVHSGGADKVGDEKIGRTLVDFLGSAGLKDFSVAHDDDPV